jgi:hypothetical protein
VLLRLELEVPLLLLKLLLLQQLQLLMRLLVMMVLLELVWLGQLGGVWLKLGIGGRSGVGGVKLVGWWWWWRTRIEDNNMTLFKVLYESMKVLKVDTTARVIATEFIFAFHGRERVEKRASVGLYGWRYLSSTAEVGGAKRGTNEGRREGWRRMGRTLRGQGAE